MEIKTFIYTTLCLIFSAPTQAAINALEGSYEQTVQDKIELSHQQSFFVSRSYSSRSVYRGILGVGWCSELEWKFLNSLNQIQKCDSVEPLQATQIRLNTKKEIVWDDFQNKKSYTFSSQGHLKKIESNDSLSSTLYLKYDPNGRIHHFLFRQKNQITTQIFAEYDEDLNVLLSLTNDQNQKTVWQSKWDGFLLANTKTQSKIEVNEYSPLGNLISQSVNGEVTEQIQYDETQDLVVMISTPRCLTQYIVSWNEKTLQQSTELRLQCQHQAVQIVKTVFNFQKINQSLELVSLKQQNSKINSDRG